MDTLREDLCTFMTIPRWILLRVINVSYKLPRENQNTHFMFNKFLLRKSCRVWDSVAKYTGLFKLIVGVLTTCHTQYTWDSSICIFLFIRKTLQVFVTYLIGALYVLLNKKIQGYSKWLSGFWQLVIHNTLEIAVYVFFYLLEKHFKFLLHTLQVLSMFY